MSPITYSPHYGHYSECFYQLQEDKSNEEFINVLCQKAYEQWIKRYESVKRRLSVYGFIQEEIDDEKASICFCSIVFWIVTRCRF